MRPQIELTNALLIFTPRQYEQYHRPFEAQIDGDALDSVMLATEEGRMITPHTLAGVASNIITPSSIPRERMDIPNGLGNDRFAFFLELTITHLGITEREIIKGFTDHVGVIHSSGAIDPNMRFHINSRSVIRETSIVNAQGAAPIRAMREDYSVLAEIPSNRYAVAMRPEDAIAYQQVAQLKHGNADVMDTRSPLRGVAKMSNVSHAVPSRYLSDLCNGYRRAQNPSFQDDISDSDMNIHDHAMSLVKAQSIMQSRFYNALNNVSPAGSHSFTFAEINAAWPRTPDFWVKSMPNPSRPMTSPTEYCHHWEGARLETIIAYSLTHILPAIMSKALLTQLELSISNMTLGNQLMIQPMNYYEMFKGTLTRQAMDHLVAQIEMDIVHGLLLPRAVVFDIHMRINLLTDSQFEISLNGGEKVLYNAPMFCESYYSPLIGMNENALAGISASMDYLAGEFGRRSDNPWDNEHVTFTAPSAKVTAAPVSGAAAPMAPPSSGYASQAPVGSFNSAPSSAPPRR